MSQTKAQLIAPVGIVTTQGVVVTGVMTATSFTGDIVGSATSIISGSNLNLGIVTAGAGFSAFSGDFTGTATGIQTGAAIKVGVFTSTSFTGDFTGTATSMMRGTGFEAGAVNATGFVANVVGNVTGNATGLAGSVTSGGNIHIGVITATSYSGDGSNLTGIAATNFNTQVVPGSTYSINVTNDGSSNYTLSGNDRNGTVSGSDPTVTVEVGDTLNFVVDASGHPFYIRVSDGGANVSSPAETNQGAQSGTVSWTPNTAGTYYYQCGNHAGMIGTITVSATTTIDLSAGNCITFNQSANTTVAFANTSTAMSVTLIRVKDATATPRTIAWPDSVKWDGGIAPSLISSDISGDFQQFQFITRDSGLSWYAWEDAKFESQRGVFIWGGNGSGRLGLNDNIQYSSPTQIPGTTWSKLDAGSNDARATKTDGTLWAWGNNSNGGLGQNERTSRSSPVQVGTDTTWSESSSVNGILATKTDGTLWAWGYNFPGNLGINANTNASRSSPVQIPGTTWRNAVIGGDMAIATKTNGTLWVWGLNEFGGCAQNISSNSNEGRSSPVQVPGTTWSTEIGVGGNQFCVAIKTDGTLWNWGRNNAGQLAHNNQTDYSSPTQVGTDTTWSKLLGQANGGGVQGWYGATKTDGTLWMWGSNNEGGALGQNDAVRYSSPVQVGTATDWNEISGGWIGVRAIKTNGDLWVWGSNGAGMLGNDSHTNHWEGISSPIQIPGSKWSGISGGATPSGIGAMAFKVV